ncbi:two-component system sensor histidine kinase NtrB [Botrimarina hoheduenensis]|uniref:histidine kinase n=1 Tax=Botrimarina hoheduenensis TaxID=2528000 RepID=A0A5C5VYS7_9BACT|nr:ATP-binding protein [Botrimarina hoheduenensis]TWT42901.1 Sensor protein FixL [Botrimarina hoheduenensis]
MTTQVIDHALEAELAELNAELIRLEELDPVPLCDPAGIDWRGVVDTSNDAFLAVDAAGVLIEWNANAESLFGWSRSEVVGRSLEETILPDGVTEGGVGGLRALAVDPRKGKRLEITTRRRDGSDLPAEVSVATMRHGSSFLFNVFVHDISARRELQSQLAHAQKLESIGQLSAGIAHEINTPTQYVGDNTRFVQEAVGDLMGVLAAFESLAAAVRAGVDTSEALASVEQASEAADLEYLKEELGEAIGQSLEGIERVTTIVRAMKEFSHPGTATKTRIDLAAAIRNTITVATNEWKYVAKIETDFDASLPPTPCLPGDFNQVVLNLIVNSAHAIKQLRGASEEKGVISVTTRRENDYAVLTIADDGCGIPPEIVGKVFDPFFTTKEVGVGTGQGLAIARSVIVDKHGGTIHVDTKVGQGTRFTIRLPLDVE